MDELFHRGSLAMTGKVVSFTIHYSLVRSTIFYMDFYEHFGKLISEKLENSEVFDKKNNGCENTAAFSESPQSAECDALEEATKRNGQKTLGDVYGENSRADLFFGKHKEYIAGEIVRDYTEDVPVKILDNSDVTVVFPKF